MVAARVAASDVMTRDQNKGALFAGCASLSLDPGGGQRGLFPCVAGPSFSHCYCVHETGLLTHREQWHSLQSAAADSSPAAYHHQQSTASPSTALVGRDSAVGCSLG